VGPIRTRTLGSRFQATRLRAAAERGHTHRPREDELALPADTPITNLASAAGLFSSWRLSTLTPCWLLPFQGARHAHGAVGEGGGRRPAEPGAKIRHDGEPLDQLILFSKGTF
jgi:hypothetical protein